MTDPRVSTFWRDQESLASRLSSLERILAYHEPWHVVGDPTTGLGTSFSNGWSNLDGRTAAFYRDGGRVFVSGVIAGGTIGFVDAFVLPEGYRPANSVQPDQSVRIASVISPVAAFDGTSIVAGQALVSTSGGVQVFGGANVYVDLSTINFRCAA